MLQIYIMNFFLQGFTGEKGVLGDPGRDIIAGRTGQSGGQGEKGESGNPGTWLLIENGPTPV